MDKSSKLEPLGINNAIYRTINPPGFIIKKPRYLSNKFPVTIKRAQKYIDLYVK